MFVGHRLRWYERVAPVVVFALLTAACGGGTVESSPAKTVDPSPAAAPSSKPSFDLTVAIAGSGVVTSNPAGIDCGSDCSESYASGTPVVLTATPGAGSLFSGWNGGGCSGTGSCTVTMTSALTTTAAFAPVTFPLNVSVSGSGTVTSSPPGINCGASCTANYNAGTSVTLTATPTAGFAFSGWSGACTGAGACSLSMSAARSVAATFVPLTFNLTVSVSGSGTVTSSPAGINCGGTCNATYNSGTSVTLTAAPAAGFSFSGWSGACTGTGACVLTMSAARAVTATFAPSTFTLNVSVSGAGSVSSTPAGISCGGDCSEAYATGTSVTLSASPASGSTFSGWSGSCTGAGTCAVTMTTARNVTATFASSTSPRTYQLSWDAVTDPRVAGYKLYFATSPFGPGVTPTTADVGNNTSYTFDPAAVGISTGATVYFGVTAVGGGLESPLSNVVNVVIQ